MSIPKFKISPPWIIYAKKLEVMFENDPEISITYNNKSCSVDIRVDNSRKAEALNILLPNEVKFGNVYLFVNVIPSNDYNYFDLEDTCTIKEIFDIAFEDNPIYAFSLDIEGLFGNTVTYVVFKNRVVQFFADNISDPRGNISTLYQDLAAEVFKEYEFGTVFYSTDIEEKVGKPLGEWP